MKMPIKPPFTSTTSPDTPATPATREAPDVSRADPDGLDVDADGNQVLARMFPPPADLDAAREALSLRAEHFRRRLSQGGSRDQYTRWLAAADALEAARAILDRPAPAPTPEPTNQGASLWALLSAASHRR